jgi:hypothetical protein
LPPRGKRVGYSYKKEGNDGGETKEDVANPIGAQLKKYALAVDNAMLAMAKLESVRGYGS